jgi:predicted nucleotidyltransferase
VTRDDIIAAILERRAIIEAEGATALNLYGSRARGDHRPDSDADFFVDHDPAKMFSLLELTGIKLLIDEALGFEAHVTTRTSLHPKLREQIEQQAVRVF